MMENRQAAMDLLEVNLRALITRIKALQAENQALKTEIETIKSEADVQKKAKEDAIDRHNFVKIASENSPGASGDELKELIDHYVKEIDKCIELLSE